LKQKDHTSLSWGLINRRRKHTETESRVRSLGKDHEKTPERNLEREGSGSPQTKDPGKKKPGSKNCKSADETRRKKGGKKLEVEWTT